MSADLFEAPILYPPTSENATKHYYLGKDLNNAQAPAIVIDVAVVRRNCRLMLESVSRLGLDFRAHVKTHKTTQLAKLQVGEDSDDIRLLVSTVAEAENLLPWLVDRKANGKKVNILYGLPITPSALPRLSKITKVLGEDSVAVIIDHPDHIELLDHAAWLVYPKIDVGYHRAGVVVGTSQFKDLAKAVAAAKKVKLAGFYAHMGHSYGVGSSEEALEFLTSELEGLEQGALSFLKEGSIKNNRYVLTLGASPTATATQNLTKDTARTTACKTAIERIKESFSVEIHAGVYPLLDMQQLATKARSVTFNDLGLRVLVEVASVYHNRPAPEALIAAGSIVMGREPCKSYPGWGVVSSDQTYDPDGERTGWIVASISQEHGVLRWEGSHDRMNPLKLGQKLLIFPNHACMAGPNFGFYLIVDSDTSTPDTVVDIWTRCRGW